MIIKSNHKPRPLVALVSLPAAVRASDFDYIADTEENDEAYDLRFFEYRGSWYDYREFEVAPNEYKALGWDGVQAESAFSAVLVQWFDRDGEERDGEIVVGYTHW